METNYGEGFIAFMIAAISAIFITMTPLEIIGLSAIIWVSIIVFRDLYWRVWL